MAFAEEERFTLRLADDEAAVVEGWYVLLEPCSHLRLPARWEEVFEVFEGFW